MAFRIVVLITILISSIGRGSAIVSAQPASSTSIGIGPGEASAAPGEIITYTVSVSHFDPSGGIQAGFSGAIMVAIPGGLSVVGQPSCTMGCGIPSVENTGSGLRIQAQVNIRDDERASMSFQVIVSTSASVGASYGLTAYLLGGTNTAGGSETAFATLTVTEPASSVDQSGMDGLEAWLDVSPPVLRVAPGGSAVYVVQPVLWGDWSTSPATSMRVHIRVPSGVRLGGEPMCGMPTGTEPVADRCDVKVEESEGSTTVILRANLADGDVGRLSLPLAFSTDLKPGSALSIQSFLQISGAGPIGNSGGGGGYQAARVIVVDTSELKSSPEAGVIHGRIEFHSAFTPQGETCTTDISNYGTDLVLYEWGSTPVLGRQAFPEGRMGEASDGSGQTVCIVEFSFEDIPEAMIVQVAHVPAGETIPCRACVFGTITPGTQSEQVFVLDW